jgi:hypothetical protein
MQRIIHHVNRVKAQPHHIRKKVAFSVAGSLTGLVALVWLSTSLATNSFAIQGSQFADAVGDQPVEKVRPDGSQLAGAAAALSGEDSTPRIQIVNVTSPTAAATTTSDTRTVIPF